MVGFSLWPGLIKSEFLQNLAFGFRGSLGTFLEIRFSEKRGSRGVYPEAIPVFFILPAHKPVLSVPNELRAGIDLSLLSEITI